MNASVTNAKYLLCVPDGWDRYISAEFYELHQGLLARGWQCLLIDVIPDAQLLAAIETAEVVLLWEAYELLERHAARLQNRAGTLPRRIFFCDDVHYFDTHRRSQRLRAFLWADRILATYPDKLLQNFPELAAADIRWSPHAAASCFQVHEPAPARAPQILLSGARSWPYPFRQFCHAKLPPEVCAVIDHPGYPGYPGDANNTMQADQAALHRLGRERYADLLRAYPAMLVCGSVFGYLVAKVFEAMACGCLTLCERSSLAPRLQALGFIEGQHYLATDWFSASADCRAVLAAFKRGDPALMAIVAAAAHKVQTEHTTAHRSEQIHQFCTEE